MKPGTDNVIGKGFKERPENIGKGRPKGLRNRATIIRELLAALDPIDGLPREYNVMKALIMKAESGDVSAIKEIQDTMYGKIPDKVLHAETEPEELDRDITDEVLKYVPTEVLEAIVNKDKE